MAFNVGPFFLKAGQSVWLTLTLGASEDHGAQWIMATPELDTGTFPQYGFAAFQVDQHIKQCFYSSDTGDKYFSYACLVTNAGSFDTFFNGQGGGNV